MAENRPGVMLYFETLQAIEELDAEEVKQIMSAILHYCRDGEEPAFRGMSAALWHMIRSGLDRDGERYSEKQLRGHWLTYCRKCKESGTAPLGFDEWAAERGDNDTLPFVERTVNVPQPSTTPSTPTTPSSAPSPSPSPSPSSTATNIGVGADKPPTRSRFVPPTLEEVTAYVRERGSMVDPQGFIDFYAAKGWMVGRNKMKDWKAACRNAEKWERWQQKGSTRNEVKTAADYGGDDFFTR